MDETTVQVMGEKDREDTQKSYMWLACGGLPEEPVALYEYRETRAAYNAKKILEGYKGFLQTDGYEGYDAALKGNEDIIHAGCFAHARRYFIEAVEISSQAEAAKKGVQYIKKLYEIESELRQRYKNERYSDEEKRKIFLRVRQLYVWGPLKKFKEWLVKVKDEYPPSLKFGKAVNYSLSQCDKLIMYLQSPYLTPDNNESERLIRPFVLGRANWLFSKSPGGAESSCGMYTFIQTAKLNGLNPQEYLQALFEKAPEVSSPEGWEKLLPWNIFQE
jgi:transposase